MATKVTPPQPVLFGCIGESAAGVLSELRGLAREESVRIRGPFGAVVFRGEEGDEIVVQSETLDELYVAERSPSPFARSDPPRRASDSEALTRREITRVLRKLRTQRTGLHRGGSPRTPLVGYIVVDLSDLESDAGEDRPSPFRVEHVPRLGRWLRESAPEIDLTLVLLTGRTAETGDDPTEPWFRAFSALMKELQEDAPIQRLYIVDGRDQHGGWVATPTELKRNAAEFIFHHGLSPYRDQLRSREERRISLDEDFLESCGTFATRSLDFEPDSIERQVAKHLADTHLDPLRRESLVGAEPKEIRRAAERAAEEIAEVHFSSSESEEDKEKKLKRILTTHLREICRERPAAKLEAFLAELRPLLARMAIDDELSERFEERYRAAHILEKQHEATYSRFLEWSKLPYRIAYDNGDRYSPRLAERPHVEVSAPPSPVWTRTGAGLLAIGLVAVAFGALGFGAFFAIAGGLLAIIGSGVIDLPVARESYEPAVYERGQPPGDVEPVEYRRKPSGPVLWIGSCLVAIGAYSALWALAPMIRVEILHPSYVPLYYIGSILFLLLGFGLSWVRRDELPFRSPELESMDSGPTVPWRLSTMGAFAIGWLALSTQLRDDAAITSSPSTLYLGCGLLALFAGVLLLRIRRPGRIKLTIEIPPRPMPLETGYHEIPSDEARAPQSRAIVEKILPWIDDLLEGDEASDEIRAWPEPRPRESVL
ncbi:MAG TPA: hypothetical protein VK116_00620, partial [Planctomycetota bacterium]|nr:hypothetical protein [Planctomycetota bacterium]